MEEPDFIDTAGLNLPLLPAASFRDDIEMIIREFDALGIDSSLSRIAKYKEVLSRQPTELEDYYFIFKNCDRKRFRSSQDFALYMMHEVRELQFIARGLKTGLISGYESKLRKIFKGNDFATDDSNKEFRNTQFELKIATYFASNEYAVDLSQTTDIVAKKGRTTFFAECKRVSSEKTLITRVSEAEKQLSKRLPKQGFFKRFYGLVFCDVSQLIAPKGLLFGSVVEEIAEIVRIRIDALLTDVDNSIGNKFSGQKLLLSFHCGVPSIFMFPPTMHTFSTHRQLIAKKASFRELFAIRETFQILVAPIVNIDPRSVQRPQIKLPETYLIPEGTKFSIDDWILEHYLEGKFSYKNDIDEILAFIVHTNGKRDEFSSWHLSMVASNMEYFAGKKPQTKAECRTAFIMGLWALMRIMEAQVGDT